MEILNERYETNAETGVELAKQHAFSTAVRLRFDRERVRDDDLLLENVVIRCT